MPRNPRAHVQPTGSSQYKPQTTTLKTAGGTVETRTVPQSEMDGRIHGLTNI